MRTFLIALMMTLASHAGAGSDLSGMLACNPNDPDEKPVLYAFDGEYLLRDNDFAYPFQHLASLPNQTELYFAYTHSSNQISEAQDRLINILEHWDNNVEWIFASRRLDNEYGKCMFPKGPIAAQRFHIALFAELLGGIYNEEEASFELPNVTLSCDDLKNLTRDDVMELAPKPQVDIKDLDQVKLTIDLSRMLILEERYSPDSNRSRRFSGEAYQCQSLGITAPEIDTSKSVTPIGKEL